MTDRSAHRSREFLGSLSGVVLMLALAGCAGGSDSGSAGRPVASGPLTGVCPATVVVQDDWWPQAENGALYGLVGDDMKVDKRKKRVAGALVDGGAATGVRIEIRSGGPANGFTPAGKVLYLNPEVTLGTVDSDLAISASSGSQPLLSVFATMDVSPLVLMWDPQAHPGWRTIADIGRTNTRVLYFPGSTYMEYLVDAGILHKSQVEASYDGTPARFIAERGRIVQQGYLTNEVYQFEHELPQWKKKVAWQLVSNAGYPIYPETLAIRPDKKAKLAPCLKKLVPILQRSAVRYAADPRNTNALIVRLVKDYGAFTYSPARAAAATAVMKQYGVLGNGSDKTVGDFDVARLQKVIDIVRPLFAAEKRPIKAGLRPADVATNEFVDPQIGMP